MSNYTKTTNFATKDALASGNPAKIVKGTEIDTEFNNIAVASGTKANKASPVFTGTATLPVTNADSLSIGGDGVTVTGIKDEDDMASNSATKLASQQSIKAYVDSQVTAQDLDVTDGTNTIAIDLDSEALSLLGGTGVTSTASGNGVTMAIDGTVATLSGSQTLTNKTLAAPAVTGALTTNSTIDGRDVAVDGTKLDGIESGATADQTAAEIKTAYESNADTNAFTDADESKLDGIEALADVTDTVNVTAAGALMDSELTSIASVKALDQGVATTDSPTFVGINSAAFSIKNADGDENMAVFTEDSGVKLYYNNAMRIQTLATGNYLAGTTILDGLQVDGDIVANGGIALGDSDKATFGASDDLQIYHDGANSRIVDTGTGNLNVQGTNLVLSSATGSPYLQGVSGGTTSVYHAGSPKLATTATGIDVTGTVVADGLTVSKASGDIATLESTTADVDVQANLVFNPVYDVNARIVSAREGAALASTLAFETGVDNTGSTVKRVLIGSGGDVSFYEDTGTTPKLTWSASGEDLNFADNVKATFGAGDDLQIYHDGSHSYISDAGTGDLKVKANNLLLQSATSENYISAYNNGPVNLYHNNNLKMNTTSTGIDVTGTVVANDLTLGDASPTINFNDSDIANLNHYITSASNANLYYAADSAAVATGKHVFTTQNVERFEISSTGIDVTGTVVADGLTVNGGGENFPVVIESTDQRCSVEIKDSFQSVLLDQNAGKFAIDIDSANVMSSSYFSVSLDGNTAFKVATGNDVEFYEDTGTTAKFFWDASAESLGIGTNAPASKLDSQETYDTVTNILTNGTYAAKFGGDTGVGAAGRAQGIMISGRNGTARGAAILAENQNSGNAHDLLFATSSNAAVPAERMRIDSVGRVGIGTDSPESKVHLRNTSGDTTLRIESGGVNGDRAGIRFQNSNDDSNHSGGIYCERESGILHSLTFETYGSGGTGTERMRIDSSGNVGIGTSSPRSLVNVTGSGSEGGILTLENSSNSLQTNRALGQLDFYSNDGSANGTGVKAKIQAIALNSIGNEVGLTFGTSGTGSATAVEAMRIDASGNASFNTTSISPASNNVFGTAILQYGGASMSRTNSTTLDLNRSTSDGAIVNFRKDGATVGSIGSALGDSSVSTLFIADAGNVGIRFDQASTDDIQPCTSTGADRDNTINLGATDNRFKDLYLSGGVYLGGTGAANKLDDYETGTFTPVMENVTGWSGSSGVDGHYTKIGNTVHVFISMTSNVALTGTPTYKITGLPFSSDLPERCSNVSISRMFGIGLTTTDYIAGVSGTEILFSYVNGNNNVNNLTHSGSTLRFTLCATYTTAA